MEAFANGIRIFYEKQGEGAPLILLHGNGETHEIFDKAVEAFSSQYTVYALDSRCHGKSEMTSTISYDEMNHGRTFLFTLPITRSMYVSSKYVTGIVICLAAWGLSVVFTGAAMAAGRISSSWEEWLLSCVMFLGVGFLFDALMIPIQLKFGADRGRIVLLVVMLGCVFLGMTAGNMIQKMQLDVSGPVAFLNGLSPVGLGLLAAVVVLAALAISWLISMGIMRKKEF